MCLFELPLEMSAFLEVLLLSTISAVALSLQLFLCRDTGGDAALSLGLGSVGFFGLLLRSVHFSGSALGARSGICDFNLGLLKVAIRCFARVPYRGGDKSSQHCAFFLSL
jgi:hypothetical protein